MHDIDRTQRELEMEAEHEHEAESPLNEAQEMEFASELLEVSNEAELEYFFGKLIRRAAGGIKSFAKSATGKYLGGALKGIAKRVLPMAATALGGAIGGPIGAKIGGGLGRLATNLFELELEGLSHEDREFEVARQMVRLSAAAVDRATRVPSSVPAQQAARRALAGAARVYAPGLLARDRHHCQACAAARGRAAVRQAAGGVAAAASYVRRSNGTRAAVRTAPTNQEYSEPGDLEPAYSSRGYPTARRGGWVRRGRHIVLTGL